MVCAPPTSKTVPKGAVSGLLVADLAHSWPLGQLLTAPNGAIWPLAFSQTPHLADGRECGAEGMDWTS